MMFRFHLQRSVDQSGVSGTGKVAEGALFTNGKVAMTWLTKHTSVATYDNMIQVFAIHGHDGKTAVVWDEPLCRGCGHLWAMHVGDNCGACEHLLCSPDGWCCSCVAMNHPEYDPASTAPVKKLKQKLPKKCQCKSPNLMTEHGVFLQKEGRFTFWHFCTICNGWAPKGR